MSTTYHHTCEYGCPLPIAAWDAGTLVPCRCGRQVKIPKLSELKRLAGQPTMCISITDQLRTMYLDQQLPPDRHCISCQVATVETLECWVECERARVHKVGILARIAETLLLHALLPAVGLVYFAVGCRQDSEPEGNDLVVRAPLSICQNCLHTTSRRESNIRQLLQTVELYRQLLEAYPGARS